MMIKMVVVVLIGAPALVVMLFEVLLNGTSMFNHWNIRYSQQMAQGFRLGCSRLFFTVGLSLSKRVQNTVTSYIRYGIHLIDVSGYYPDNVCANEGSKG